MWGAVGACVVLVFLGAQVGGEVFTALAQLEKSLLAEQKLAEQIRQYVQQETERLQQLQSVAADMERHSTELLVDSMSHLGHPVNAFLLVKRFTVDLHNIINTTLTSQPTHDVMADIEVTMSAFPQQDDLKGAARALLRLQDTYDLSPYDLSRGHILKSNTSVLMTAADCFELGRQAYDEGDHHHSIMWLTEALSLQSREPEPTTSRASILDYLAYSTYKQGNIHHAYNLTMEWISLEPNHNRARTNLAYYKKVIKEEDEKYVLQRLAPPPNDVIRNPPQLDEHQSSEAHQNYVRLCRGEDTKVNPDGHRLTCQYKRHHPMFYINPVREEVMYFKPFIAIYHQLLSDTEQALIKELAIPKLHRSGVFTYVGGNQQAVQNYRTSQSAWLSDSDHPVIARLTARTSALSSLTADTVEQFQVVNYGIGGHYEPHFDFARDSEKSTFEPGVGNRIATIIYYVAAPETGGATVFPDLGVKLWPEKGSCALWYNLLRNGEGDYNTKHAGCPTLTGSKWIANKWYHERGQELIRPCTSDPEE